MKCRYCSEEFLQNRPNQLSCSLECSIKYNVRKRPKKIHDRNCVVCSSEYKSKDKHSVYCSKECGNRARYIIHSSKYRQKLIKSYGITEEIYLSMLEEQDNCCAICGNEENCINPKTGYPYPLVIDHCHETGKVRGLLCKHCNLVLGQVEKRPEIIAGCLEYLNKELKKVRG